MIKVSDYLVKRLEEHGVKDVFLLSGGNMMHMLDSVANSEKINYYCNLNEQASAICADAYAQATRDLAVCMVTAGPGATNALTGAVNSFIDSEPVLVISGQAKVSDLVGDSGVRQVGGQEVNIVSMVQCVSKYAVTVKDPLEIKYHIDKAIYLATHGRKGMVWIDMPLDIQAARIDETQLIEFDPVKEGLAQEYAVSDEDMAKVLEFLKEAKRPAILVGKGVVADRAESAIRQIAERLHIPVLATWRAKMVFADDNPWYFGHPGSPGPRYSNFILQNCDYLLVIGTRLNPAITAFNDEHFAFNAKKTIVDIDPNEIKRLKIDFENEIVCSAGVFCNSLNEKTRTIGRVGTDEWLTYCRDIKQAYPLYKEKQAFALEYTDMYLFGHKLSKYTKKDDVIVEGSSGRSCGIIGLSYERSEGQIEIGAMGLGSMGFALPAAIGASVACGKSRVITLEGDGSLQHNLQELALVNGYGIPLKLFVLNNGGYASIAVMQDNHFKSHYVGCFPNNGVFCCNLKKLAALYDLDYYRIEGDRDVDTILKQIMKDDRPVLCEVITDYTFDEIPKAKSKINEDGTMSSSSLEDLFPFLPQDETDKWMRISK